ncbi:RagB/SusD family nutrient uptake outer membrane protein [Chitinophaga barathri]|uniref:RagB/SusD family nutrient uptake outer membrane protein n=1 Tax=Chitinophaga barathri TaxID=1647451 RepID=A0A3N4MCE1_9BACT|nr:RagB/SusD family nutrient uptake outer membrane protein [Chitinophaga barathri]RPD39546.1 RagB/SusD family nutrient uptake outer membrane protein [Chitinophaga barathri]
MKKIIITITLFAGMFVSCKSVLDIEDINTYDPEQVWNDENLANAYIANLYSLFGNWSPSEDRFSEQVIGIALPRDFVTISNASFKVWDYTRIRLINQALVNVGTGKLSDNARKGISGQALFLRAFLYFNMVRHHGGVPYVKVPQDKDTDDLYVPRNSTAECFEFILKDLDDAIALLPARISPSAPEYGRIDAAFALAFKAKVLLYKASPQFHPSNPWDNADWATAYTANKKAYDDLKALGFSLVEDYSNIALVEKGPETVFPVINQYPSKVTNWDNGVRPASESRGPASAVPTWEMVKMFPMKDGKRYNDATSPYYKTDAQFLQSYWENRDPRFNKSVVWSGKPYPVSGKTGKRLYTSLGISDPGDDFGTNPDARTNSTNLDRYSGFFMLKNSLLRLTQAQVLQYDVDFVYMRFAEVMLNYAETANETGKPAEALDILKQLRLRAGIEPGADGNFGIVAPDRVTMREAILMERNIELCFEGHRFWDLRRLRMLDRLDNSTKFGVEAIPINPDGSNMSLDVARTKANANELTETNFRYVLHQVPRSGVKVNTVPATYYFFPIHKDVLDRNPSLQQNKDWGGNFNPALD